MASISTSSKKEQIMQFIMSTSVNVLQVSCVY